MLSTGTSGKMHKEGSKKEKPAVMEDDEFKRRLRERFTIRIIEGNGNCFFEAIAHHHFLAGKGIPARQMAVRQDLYAHVLSHRDYYMADFLNNEEFLHNVGLYMVPFEFCPSNAPVAAARHYRINVVVIQPGISDLVWNVFPDVYRNDTTLYLSYHNPLIRGLSHYNVLIPKDEYEEGEQVSLLVAKNISEQRLQVQAVDSSVVPTPNAENSGEQTNQSGRAKRKSPGVDSEKTASDVSSKKRPCPEITYLSDTRTLLEQDYKIFEMLKDSNSFYSCLARRMHKNPGAHDKVRTEVHEFALWNWMKFVQYFPDVNKVLDKDLHGLPDFVLFAASIKYKKNVVIIKGGASELSWEVVPENAPFDETIYLYNEEGFYHFLSPRNATTAEAKLDEYRKTYNDNESEMPEDEDKQESESNVAEKGKAVDSKEGEVKQTLAAQDKSNNKNNSTAAEEIIETDDNKTTQKESGKEDVGAKNLADGAPVGEQVNDSSVKVLDSADDSKKNGESEASGAGAFNENKEKEADEEDDAAVDCEEKGTESAVDEKRQPLIDKDGKYVCRLCGSKLNSIASFRTHMSNSHNLKQFACEICGKILKSRQSLSAHMRSVHGPPQTCTICGRTYKSKKALYNHMRDLHGLKTKCPICQKELSCKEALRNHMFTQHSKQDVSNFFESNTNENLQSSAVDSGGGVNSITDNVAAASGTQLKTEDITVDSDGFYVCPTCGRKFKSQNDLKWHMRMVHGIGLFTCECGKQFPGLSYLNMHVKRIHDSESSVCTFCGKIVKHLEKHVTLNHSSNQFKCEDCGKIYNLKLSLTYHVLTEHGGECVCPECGHMFKGDFNLRRHIRHQHAGEHHPCQEEGCTSVFPSSVLLHAHTRSVHVDRHHVCEYCLEAFKLPGTLRQHIENVHNNERKYACTAVDCNARFKSARLLIKHETVHSKGRPFKCNICGASFKYNGNLHIHLFHIHGEEKPEIKKQQKECLWCFPHPQFRNASSWELHRLMRHPDKLHRNDAQSLEQLYVSPTNRIYLLEDDIDQFMNISNLYCKTCDMKFVSKEAEKIHLQFNHIVQGFSAHDFKKALYACRQAENEQRKKECSENIYNLSKRVFPVVDQRRKVYDILLVPSSVDVDTLDQYLADAKNTFFNYCGRYSRGVSKHWLISPHHTAEGNVVSTNIFVRIQEMLGKKFSAYLINEKAIDVSASKGGNGLETEKKEEAIDILTVFLFAVFYKREDVFMQTLEWGEIKKLSLKEISDIVDDVRSSKGCFWKLKRFTLGMIKHVEIRPAAVDSVEKYKCKACKNQPIFPTSFQLMRHRSSRHETVAVTATERLYSSSESLNPKNIFKTVRESASVDASYFVYLCVGSNKKINTLEEALKLVTSGYVGKSTDNPVAAYHFLNSTNSSGLRKLRRKFRYVYLILNWKFKTEREMDRAEAALIISGGNLLKSRKPGRQSHGLSLINEFMPWYAVSHLFTRAEWVELTNESEFKAVMPSFISVDGNPEQVVDITNRLTTSSSAEESATETSDSEEEEENTKYEAD